MLEDLKALFQLYGDKIINDMIDKMNAEDVHHTMTAAKSLRYKATTNSLSISGVEYVDQISEGRRAWSKPPPPMNLTRWIQDKMGENDPKTIKRLSFALSKSIAAKGTVGIGLYDFVINKNINALADDMLDIVDTEMGKRIKESLKTTRYSRIQVSV